jgi:hypothetical protein
MSNPRNQSFTFEWDIGKQITYQPVNMAKPSIPVKVEFEVISKEDKKTWEPEIQQRMMDAMKDVFSAGVTVIGKLMMETDRQLSLSRTPLVVDCIRILKNFERECREQTRFLENRAKMAAQQEWDALLRTQEQYRNYQLKTGWQIGSSVVGIVLGISSAITASPPALVVGIIAMCRSLVDVIKTVVNAWYEAEELGQNVTKELKELAIEFAKSNRSSANAHEVKMSVLNTLLQLETFKKFDQKLLHRGICHGVFNTSIIKSDCELWGNKILGLRIAISNFAKELDNVLKAMDKTMEDLREGKKDLAPDKRSRVGEFERNIKELEKKTNQLLGGTETIPSSRDFNWWKQRLGNKCPLSIPLAQARHADHEKAQKAAGEALQALMYQTSGWTMKFDTWFGLAVNLGLTAAAGYAVPIPIDGFGTSVKEIGHFTVGAAMDLYSTATSLKEAISG